MTKTNMNSKGRNKPRHNGGNGNRTNGSPVSRNSVFDSNGPCGKIRGNVSQIIEKYQAAAKDASTHSEYVLAELCLQYADHYNRINISFTPENNNTNPNSNKNNKSDKAQKSANGKGNGKTSEDAKIAQSDEEPIDISGIDLSIPDFSIIENNDKKTKADEDTSNLAIENV